jgi:ribosomal protein S24E
MFPFDQYYFLLHAYDVLGRHLYGTDWTGQELMEARLDAPEVVEQQRAPFERRIAEVNARHDEIRAAIRREIKEELVTALRQESEALFVERAQLQGGLHRLPIPNEDYRRSHVAHRRAEKTQAFLIEALESDAIRAQAGMGIMIHWSAWSKTPGFRCYLPLSLVVMPRSVSGLRRATVLIRRQEFDTWLQCVPTVGAEPLGAAGPRSSMPSLAD